MINYFIQTQNNNKKMSEATLILVLQKNKPTTYPEVGLID